MAPQGVEKDDNGISFGCEMCYIGQLLLFIIITFCFICLLKLL